MTEIIDFQKITFKDVTQELRANFKNQNYPYKCWQCWYGEVYLGLISWSESNEQYGFYPQIDTQIVITAPIMHDIYDKMWELMKDRVLN